jgi:hypothetical protein
MRVLLEAYRGMKLVKRAHYRTQEQAAKRFLVDLFKIQGKCWTAVYITIFREEVLIAKKTKKG